jgi:hypothetical protein
MPQTSKDAASETVVMDGFEGRYERIDGGYTIGFESYTADVDAAELFRGLPEDRCQCPHWGYVLAGKVTFRYADREETYHAGEAYYAPPGHTPVLFAGAEVVEFSPTDALDETIATVTENLRTAGAEA